MLAQSNPPGTNSTFLLVVLFLNVLGLCGIVWGIKALFRYLRRVEPRGGANKEISLGVAGLVLVSLRLLEFAGLRAGDIGDFFWFVSAVGIFASLVGLIISIVALFRGSGRGAATVGIALFVALAVLFMAVPRA